MLMKFSKYFVAFTIFVISCISIIHNKEDIQEVTGFSYNQNNYTNLAIEYIATLNIPKISLNKVLYDINDKKNNLDENIIFVNGSSLPDEEKGNVIIAGHNGNSKISFFKNLNKLNIDDVFHITYQKKRYTYKIVKKYLVEKDGDVEILKDNRYSTATLITCHGKKEQLVIIANLYAKKIID